jgi:glutathione S-transferase
MKLYHHPLSTYSQKAVMALHEKSVEFTSEIVSLFDADAREAYRKIYPMGKIPVLVREDGWMIPESSIIVEYLDTHFDSGPRLIPEDKDLARQVRFKDRMFDLYLNESVANLIFQSWKEESERDQELIDRCNFRIGVMYDFMDKTLGGEKWAAGDEFTMADCAAAPCLFYAQEVAPFADRANITAYWERVSKRPSSVHVAEAAAPYLEKLRAEAI